MKEYNGKVYRVRSDVISLNRKERMLKKEAILDSYDESIDTLEQEIAELIRMKKRAARKAAPKTSVKFTKVFEGENGYEDLDDRFCPEFYQGYLQWIQDRDLEN